MMSSADTRRSVTCTKAKYPLSGHGDHVAEHVDRQQNRRGANRRHHERHDGHAQHAHHGETTLSKTHDERRGSRGGDRRRTRRHRIAERRMSKAPSERPRPEIELGTERGDIDPGTARPR
jgi:hypothetical protein